MNVRRFNGAGEEKFLSMLRALKAGDDVDPSSIVDSPEFAEPLVEVSSLDRDRVFARRLDCAQYLNEVFGQLAGAARDSGIWSWLSAVYFDQLCRKNSAGRRDVKDFARYVPEKSFRRFYRHLLLGPFLVYRAHKDRPEVVRAVLAGPLHTPGDLAEQLASRIEIVTNAAIMGVATELYYDSLSGGLKRGAGGKGAGSPRRLADVVNQLDLTVDMYAMQSDRLLAILPREFARFKV